MIFQQFNLVPRLSVLTNVCLGRLGRMPFLQATLGHFTLDEKRRAMRALARVGIAEHALKRGCDLSGGQQQRAAIARTLVQGAEFIVADEPIASLDPESARRVMDILADLNRGTASRFWFRCTRSNTRCAIARAPSRCKAGEIVYDGPSRALTPEFLASSTAPKARICSPRSIRRRCAAAMSVTLSRRAAERGVPHRSARGASGADSAERLSARRAAHRVEPVRTRQS